MVVGFQAAVGHGVQLHHVGCAEPGAATQAGIVLGLVRRLGIVWVAATAAGRPPLQVGLLIGIGGIRKSPSSI
jgi:hypothetical protein